MVEKRTAHIRIEQNHGTVPDAWQFEAFGKLVREIYANPPETFRGGKPLYSDL